MTTLALVLHLVPILVSVGLLVAPIEYATQREPARVAPVEWSAQPRPPAPGSALPDLPALLRGVTAYLPAPAPARRVQGAITLGLRN